MRIFAGLDEEIKYRYVCLHYKLTTKGRIPRKKILVNGSPKTGTTWMYRILECIPGYAFVGNYQFDSELYNKTKQGYIIHGHEWFTPALQDTLNRNQIHVIQMMRDPRDQTISHVFHILRDINNPMHQIFSRMSIEDAITAHLTGIPELRDTRSLIELTKSWNNREADAIFIKYEELKHNPYSIVNKLLNDLDIPSTSNLTRTIISRNRFERLSIGKRIWKKGRKPGQGDPGSHFRKGIIGDWRNWFTKEHIKLFKEIAGTTLIEWGYESNQNWGL